MSSQSVSDGLEVRGERVPVRLLPDHMIAIGEPVVTTERASDLVALEPRSLYGGLSRLRRQGRLFSPARGLHVAVPPEYRSWGVVPASWWIDPMMDHLGRRYCVGLLSAAAVHGAAHQAPQVFQVFVDEQLADRDIGRVRVSFHVSSVLAELPGEATGSVVTETGSMVVSSPELTAIDLVADPDLGGGLDNVATVLTELEGLDEGLLSSICSHYPRAVARRLGWLLDNVVEVGRLEPLQRLADPGAGSFSPLDVHGSSSGRRDDTWGVVVNTSVEPDL